MFVMPRSPDRGTCPTAGLQYNRLASLLGVLPSERRAPETFGRAVGTVGRPCQNERTMRPFLTDRFSPHILLVMAISSRLGIFSAVTLVLALALWCGASQAQAGFFNGVEFPLGRPSFVDSVLRFVPDFSGGPVPTLNQAYTVLGPPSDTSSSSQSLGYGGLIELNFDDNFLVNDGSSAPDLYIGEGMGTAESVFVSIRPTVASLPKLDPTLDENGDGFFELGHFLPVQRAGSYGFLLLIDIDVLFQELPYGAIDFDAIQLIDDMDGPPGSGGGPGFDLEAVGAISGLARGASRQFGDTDADGDVDLADLNNVRNGIGASSGGSIPLLGDAYPYDYRVDLSDLNLVRNHFGAISMTAVPEPASLALATLGMLASIARKRCIAS